MDTEIDHQIISVHDDPDNPDKAIVITEYRRFSKLEPIGAPLIESSLLPIVYCDGI